MNLIVSSLMMVDLGSQEAKKISFVPTKNFITSARNHMGKSVIMKSIYYSLGADVYYPATIKRPSFLTIIEFSLDRENYRVARLGKHFCAYHNDVLVSSYSSVRAFNTFLAKLFGFEIDLVGKGTDEEIVVCPPTFYFLPYYIDQENGWSATSYSFRDAAMVDAKQRKNSYHFHLGSLDASYVVMSKQAKNNDERIKKLQEENEKLRTVVSTLQTGIDGVHMSFDYDSLELTIAKRRQEIDRILQQIESDRNSLLKLEDESIRIAHEKGILSKYIQRKEKLHVSVEDHTVECPRCGNLFNQSVSEQLEKTYLTAKLFDDYAKIIDEEKTTNTKIEKYKSRFEDSQLLLKGFERSLSVEVDAYEAYVKSKATNQLLSEYNARIGSNTTEISKLEENNKGIRKQIRSFNELKAIANEKYLLHFHALLSQFDIPEEQIEDGSELGASITASGAYGPRAKISQVLAFVEAKQQEAPETISFPIVIDSPNSLEQDSEHFENVMRTLLTWENTDNQIIVSSIQGAEIAASIKGVNIIALENEPNHMLNSEEYLQNEDEITDIITHF